MTTKSQIEVAHRNDEGNWDEVWADPDNDCKVTYFGYGGAESDGQDILDDPDHDPTLDTFFPVNGGWSGTVDDWHTLQDRIVAANKKCKSGSDGAGGDDSYAHQNWIKDMSRYTNWQTTYEKYGDVKIGVQMEDKYNDNPDNYWAGSKKETGYPQGWKDGLSYPYPDLDTSSTFLQGQRTWNIFMGQFNGLTPEEYMAKHYEE
jgi:hypothetical protein